MPHKNNSSLSKVEIIFLKVLPYCLPGTFPSLSPQCNLTFAVYILDIRSISVWLSDKFRNILCDDLNFVLKRLSPKLITLGGCDINSEEGCRWRKQGLEAYVWKKYPDFPPALLPSHREIISFLWLYTLYHDVWHPVESTNHGLKFLEVVSQNKCFSL